MEKYVGKGYTGLKNLGNTCFINSCLQVLSHTYELTEILHNESVVAAMKPNTPETVILMEYRNLIDLMWSRNGIVGPNRFIHILHHVARIKNKEIFTGFAQNDTSELLQFLVDCFHESLSRALPPFTAAAAAITVTTAAAAEKIDVYEKCTEALKQTYEKEYSEIMELFYGMNVSRIMSPILEGGVEAEENQIKVVTPEPFFILNVPIPAIPKEARDASQPPSLYDCIGKFTEIEVLAGENKWFNESTNAYEDVLKKYDLYFTPPILVVLINRFYQNPNIKNETLVKFPHELFLETAAASNPQKYDLYGVCNHIGNAMFGHYTSFVKNAANEWLFYNDANITKVASPNDVVTPMAYCLFYRRLGVAAAQS